MAANSGRDTIGGGKKACRLLGARPSYAGQKNGGAIVDNMHYEEFAQRLNAEAPDAVFTHWMLDNHRDHRAIAMLSYDAWQRSGRKYALYYYEVSDGEDTMQFSPNRFVDITGWSRARRPRATRMTAKRRIATMSCRTEWLASEAWKAATRERKRSSGNNRVRSISSLLQ